MTTLRKHTGSLIFDLLTLNLESSHRFIRRNPCRDPLDDEIRQGIVGRTSLAKLLYYTRQGRIIIADLASETVTMSAINPRLLQTSKLIM